MANLPTPGGSSGTWGAELNAYLDENFTAIRDSLDVLLGNLPNLPTTTLAVNVTGNTILLSWTGVSGATGYLVGRDGTDQFGTIGSIVQVASDVTSRSFPNLTYGTEYTFTVQPTPGGRIATIKATTSAPPTGNTSTTVSVVAHDGRAVLTWTPVTGATGYLVGRDGVDTFGSGAWSTTDPASATSRSFNSLVNGTLYTLFCEPQGTGAPSFPTVGHGRKTITVTPTAASVPVGQTVVSVGTVTNTSIVLNWTAVSGSTGYVVGRDGVDASGNGAWQTSVGSGVLTYTFSNLVPGNGYTMFVTPQPGGTRTEITRATTVTGTDPGTPPTGTGTTWISGWAGGTDSQTARASATTWRGELIEYQRAWFPQSTMTDVGSVMTARFTGYTGYLDLALGGPGGIFPSWAQAASGAMDATWQSQCQQIHANWGSLAGVTLSMAHELNSTANPWAVNATSAPFFIEAWKRFYAIVTAELKSKGRNVKVCLNYAAGSPNVAAIWPGNAFVDVVGVSLSDNNLPTSTGNVRTQTEWDAFVNSNTTDGSPYGPNAWVTFAASKSKPISFPEWALSKTAADAYDNPFWIQKMYDFFASIAPAAKYNPAAGKLYGEMYFMLPGWSSTLYPTTTNPLSASRMQSLNWGSLVTGNTAAGLLGWGTPTWTDDSAGTTIDSTKWQNAPAQGMDGHAGNGRRIASSTTIVNGVLTLHGYANGDTGWIRQNLSVQYGRWEIRVRSRNIGTSGGLYHVLALIWPTSELWPADGEYDWLENVDPNQQKVGAFLHYPHPNMPVQQEYAEKTGVNMNDWQNIAFEWSSSGLKGWVNGVQFYSFANGANASRSNIQAMPQGKLTLQLDNFTGDGGLREAIMEVDSVYFWDI